MSMIIDLSRSEDLTQFAKQEGKYLFKITDLKEDGAFHFYMHFEGIIIGDETKEKFSHKERFSLEDDKLKFLKDFAKNIGSPLNVDIFNWIGRYVYGTLRVNSKDARYLNCIKWEYCTHNDKLEPIPVAVARDGILRDAIESEPTQDQLDELPF